MPQTVTVSNAALIVSALITGLCPCIVIFCKWYFDGRKHRARDQKIDYLTHELTENGGDSTKDMAKAAAHDSAKQLKNANAIEQRSQEQISSLLTIYEAVTVDVKSLREMLVSLQMQFARFVKHLNAGSLNTSMLLEEEKKMLAEIERKEKHE